MAVLQISRVQHRRGLQQDLPQLASAELGWSIDQRRLFIGNGTTEEGAPVVGMTEILTQHTDFIDVIKFYSYKGESTGYIAQTGVSSSAPVVRTAQAKFDEVVSVKDFGAMGDGYTNDYAAIMRAITEIYRRAVVENNPAARRAIFFPAGVYNIQDGVLVFPTWLTVYGEGISNSKIVQDDASQPYVIRFSDSAYEISSNMGTSFVTLPTDILIEKLTIQQNNDKSLILVDSVTNLNFRLVAFKGAVNANNWTEGASAIAGIDFAATQRSPDNITFEMCKFDDMAHVVYTDVAANNVRFNNCIFTMLYSAFKLGSSNNSVAPSNFRITNSVFKDIAYLAIDSYEYVTGVVSTGNSYYNVADNASAVINYRGDGNYSMYDYFQSKATGRVVYNDKKVITLQAEVGLQLGTYTIGTGSVVTLRPTDGNMSSGITLPKFGTMNYQLLFGESSAFGSITFSGDMYTDNFVSESVNHITFSIQNSVLRYENNGPTATLRYNINHF